MTTHTITLARHTAQVVGTMGVLVLGILSCASLCLVVYASAALGHSFANHKMALSVAFFFALGMKGSSSTPQMRAVSSRL